MSGPAAGGGRGNGEPTTVHELLRVVGLLQPHRGGFQRGKVYFLTRLHDPHCRRPDGGPCTCVFGPDEVIERYQPAKARA